MAEDKNPKRILVVDDERNIADTLAAIFRMAGFESRAVYSGKEAINIAGTFRPDILLTDYHMPPGMDGIEAAIEVKKLLPGCRIVMLSGQLLADNVAPFASKGYNFLLLSKPMHPEELLGNINDGEVVSESTEHPRILNVDDVETHRYSISRLLAHAGFEVSEASTGQEAIRQAVESQPELVLLDIHLPDFSGYDVCKAIKENPETCHVSVVHITASEKSPAAALRSANVGAEEYLTHPIAPKRLVHRIRELLQLKYLQRNIQ